MTRALAIARGSSSQYTYTYYQDAAVDLSGNVSAGGWLKATTDPTGLFVVFGYDRAGNVARTWDRNATSASGLGVASFPGTLASPPSQSYTETVRGAYASPWRSVTSQRDQLGDTTTYPSIDSNGNVLTMRTPRGNQASNSLFDITYTYDNGDNRLSRLLPTEAAANKPTQSATTGSGDCRRCHTYT